MGFPVRMAVKRTEQGCKILDSCEWSQIMARRHHDLLGYLNLTPPPEMGVWIFRGEGEQDWEKHRGGPEPVPTVTGTWLPATKDQAAWAEEGQLYSFEAVPIYGGPFPGPV